MLVNADRAMEQQAMTIQFRRNFTVVAFGWQVWGNSIINLYLGRFQFIIRK